MKEARRFTALLVSLLMIAPAGSFAANHRSAPISALDHPAGITDWYAFVSYDDPTKVTMILDVDPLLEPSNGPNYFPFDPHVVYSMKIDNDYDGVEDLTFEFRFTTEIRAPGIPLGFVGAGGGINAPANAPLPLNGTERPTGGVIPRAITALDGSGAAGFSLRQTYTVTLVRGTGATATRTELTPAAGQLIAVPSNVGPRTMPNYAALAKQGIFSVGNGVRVFAGTVDDPFYIDLGGAFDSLNFRQGSSFLGAGGWLSALQDQNDTQNYAADALSGFNVNTIAIEVPISLITRSKTEPVIGTWGATYRPRTSIRNSPNPETGSSDYAQVQRMGNPLINELIIGTGSKDKFSMSEPKDDAQFAAFALDPVLARVLNAVYGITVPDAPRTDLLPLVQYAGPTIPAGTPGGPVADVLRLNTSIAPAPAMSRKRLGLLAGDAAGFPNGRRVSDDVTDIAARAVAGALCGLPGAGCKAGGVAFTPAAISIGDGVNTNDMAYQETFPYVAWAQSGRDRVHQDPGERGCAQGNGTCPQQ